MAQMLRIISAPIVRNIAVNKSAKLLPIASTQCFQSKRELFGFGKKDDIRLPDPVEHATGLEKLLLLAEEKGIDDPFCLKPRTRGPGTKGTNDYIIYYLLSFHCISIYILFLRINPFNISFFSD